MHNMDNTPKIITIIGLILEGIAVVALIFTSILFMNIDKLPGLGSALEAELPQDEYIDLMNLMGWIGDFLIVMTIILGVFFIINIYLFPRLMRGKYTEEQAKKIYLYQAIWGGINLLSNQITGILYLISGVQGYNGRKETVDVRDGI